MLTLPGSSPMGPDDLRKHVLDTYLSLRKGIAIIGVAFPVILAAGGLYWGLCLQASMSAYYHASYLEKSMRDWFVGILFAVGVFLYLYKGFSVRENYLLNAAGMLAIGVAIVPTKLLPCEVPLCIHTCLPACAPQKGDMFTLHGFFAVSFFICIALVCLTCAGDTLPLVPDARHRARLKATYQWIGFAMLALMALAWFFNTISDNPSTAFWVEAVGVFFFAAYWWVKSTELKQTSAHEKAVEGKLKRGPGEIELI